MLFEDTGTIRTYYRILEEGKTKNNRIRLIVVGMYEVGKTALVNNLVENLDEQIQDVQMRSNESTEGIDVHLCEITEGNTWNKLKSKRNQKQMTHVLNNATQEEQQCGDASHTTSDKKAASVTDGEQKLKLELEKEEFQGFEPAPLTDGENKLKLELKKEALQALLALEPSQDCPLISVWDFAGQNVYYSTHHFFLNEGSIYLLLMDMTEDIDSETKQHEMIESFKFWINSIHMYSSMYDVDKELKPTIILVGTHKDKMHGTDNEKKEYMARNFNKALETFQDNMNIINRICPKMFLVNNLDAEDPEYAKIREEVRNLAEQQCYWNEKQPVKFVQLEKAFDEVRQTGKEIITFKEVRKLNKNIPAPLESDNDIIYFLKLQHLNGNVLFFDTDALRGHVILSPQWIIKAFKCFINHKDAHIPPRLLRQWNEYRRAAILSEKLLVDILKKSAYQLDCQIEVVIGYMEHLNVMAKPICPEDFPEEDNSTEKDPSTIDKNARKVNRQPRKRYDFYIVPCQLQTKPNEDIDKLTNPENWYQTQALCFVFKDMFMPPATFHRLVVACMREWEIAQTNGAFMVYNRFGAFKTSERSQLRLWYWDHIIYAKMVFKSQKEENDYAVDPNTCQNCRRILYENLMAILGLLPRSSNITKYTPFEEYIQCPNLTKHNQGLFKVNDCIVKDEFACADDHEDNESHSMNTHVVLKFWYKETLDEIDGDRDRDFDRVPTDVDLSKIAQSLEKMKEIWLLGIELGVPNVKLEEMKFDSWQKKRDFSFSVLMEWRRSKCEALPKLRKTIRAVQKNKDHFIDIYDILDANDPCNAASNSGLGC